MPALSFTGKLKGFFHGYKQAFAVNADRCHACGLCVTACPAVATAGAARRPDGRSWLVAVSAAPLDHAERFLIERARRRDAEAFAALYDDHRDAVYRYLYYRVGNPSTCEDLADERADQDHRDPPREELPEQHTRLVAVRHRGDAQGAQRRER